MRCYLVSPPTQDLAPIEIDFLNDDALAIDLYLADLRRRRHADALQSTRKRASSRWRRLLDRVNGLGMPPAHQLDIY